MQAKQDETLRTFEQQRADSKRGHRELEDHKAGLEGDLAALEKARDATYADKDKQLAAMHRKVRTCSNDVSPLVRISSLKRGES
jgi:hypothetical protein